MINNYTLYYNYKNCGDVLFVVIDNEKMADKYVKTGDVVSIYNENVIIGYNIFNCQKLFKIHTSGIIFNPNPLMLKVINNVLRNAKLDELDVNKKSGYIIAKVYDLIEIEDNKVFVTLDSKTNFFNAIDKKCNLKINDLVVIVTSNNRLYNGNLVKESNYNGTLINAKLCHGYDLDIKDYNDVFICDDEVEIGKEFFTWEAK